MSFKEFFKPDKIKLIVTFALFIAGVFSGRFGVLNFLILAPLISLGFGAFIISLILDFAVTYLGVCIVVGIIKEVAQSVSAKKPQEQKF